MVAVIDLMFKTLQFLKKKKRLITLGKSSPVKKVILMCLLLHFWPLPLNTDHMALGILRYKGK